MTGLLWNNRGAGSITLMLAALLALALAPPGCTEEPGEPCVGGFLRDGVCEAKCDPTKCLEGNVCVDNQCTLLCTRHDDCFFGVQECQDAVEDDTQAPVQVCLSNGRQPVLTDGFPVGTIGFGCPFGEDQCSASACPNGLECDPAACGDCELDTAACGDKEQCNIGRCASSGEACTFNTCPANECKKLTCITAGEGDANAYCTANDCSADSDCPGGFYCGVSRDARTVCGRTCNNGSCSHDGSPCSGNEECEKGFDFLCGNTLEGCIEESELSANGNSFFDGALCLLRRTCLRTDECTPCSDNLDCNQGPADVCVDNNGESVCARFCGGDNDCTDDKSCVPYGNTCQTAPGRDCVSPEDCPDNGACVPRSVCVPRSGSCRATPDTPNYCSHCVDDADCGGSGSGSVCAQSSSGESACLDFSINCSDSSQCPTAPSGAQGICVTNPQHPLYQRCWFPEDSAESSFTCYP